MQSEDKQFDLIVRSMMNQAQEEVPSGVWDAVSSSLPGGRKVIPFWTKAALAAALAAAAVAGVFVISRNNSTFQHIPTSPSAVAVLPSESLVAGAAADAAALPPGGLSSASVPSSVPAASSAFVAPSPAGKPQSQPASTEAGEFETPSQTSDALVVEEVPASVQESEEAAAVRTVEAEKPAEAVPESRTAFQGDPFMIAEPGEKPSSRHRREIQAGGNFLTNGDPASTAGLARRYSSGSIHPSRTTVTQTGAESTYSVPLSLGLGVRWYLGDRLFVGSGLSWSMLERSFDGVITEVKDGAVRREVGGEVTHSLHYVGLPVNVGYQLLRGDKMSFYAYAGAMMEKGLRSGYRVSGGSGSVSFHESVHGVQLSAGAGIGLEFRLSGQLGLYLDPSLRYYFDCNQPTSIRTQQPLMMGLEAGLRFGF